MDQNQFKTKIQLQTSSILDVPVNVYNQDFMFIVNKEEFRTTKIISDLLSPKICQIHSIDPTYDTYIITTTNKGHFSYILNLLKFEEEIIPSDELLFLSEVLEDLQNKNITVKLPNRIENFNMNNIFEFIKIHEKNQQLYKQYFEEELEFIAKNFFKLNEEQEKKFEKLRCDTIEKVLSHSELQIQDENQLLRIINQLYNSDSRYSILYKFVYFIFVDEEKIQEFIEIFDFNDIDGEIWSNISIRLKQKIDKCNDENYKHHQCKLNGLESESKLNGLKFECLHNNQFDGIINFLRKKSNDNIKSMINITASSIIGDNYSPYNACLFKDNYFESNNENNSWICFDFKEHKIIPSNYIIKSCGSGQPNKPKTWILEGSNDQTNWQILDEQNNCPHLKGSYAVHTFDIQKENIGPFKYIRIKQTGNNWQGNYYYFTMNSIEFYGYFI